MSKKETALATTGVNLPAHLQDQKAIGLDKVGENTLTPRLCITHSTSSAELKSRLPEKSISLSATDICVAEALATSSGIDGVRASESFIGVPVYHWVTFEKRSDFQDTSTDFIVDSTQDRDSELARRCEDFDLQEEEYTVGQKKFTYKYLKCLNYIIEIQTGEAAGEICAYTYCSGDYRTGRQFNSLLKRRGVSIFNNRVEFFTMHRTNKQGNNWLTIGFSDPQDEDGNYIQSSEESKRLMQIYQDFAAGEARVVSAEQQ